MVCDSPCKILPYVQCPTYGKLNWEHFVFKVNPGKIQRRAKVSSSCLPRKTLHFKGRNDRKNCRKSIVEWRVKGSIGKMYWRPSTTWYYNTLTLYSILTTTSWHDMGNSISLHFVEESKVHISEWTCTRSHGWYVAKLGFKPRCS